MNFIFNIRILHYLCGSKSKGFIMNEQIKYFPPLVEVMDVNAEGVLCASGANAPEWDVEEW